jgi:hypothetical protein
MQVHIHTVLYLWYFSVRGRYVRRIMYQMQVHTYSSFSWYISVQDRYVRKLGYLTYKHVENTIESCVGCSTDRPYVAIRTAGTLADTIVLQFAPQYNVYWAYILQDMVCIVRMPKYVENSTSTSLAHKFEISKKITISILLQVLLLQPQTPVLLRFCTIAYSPLCHCRLFYCRLRCTLAFPTSVDRYWGPTRYSNFLENVVTYALRISIAPYGCFD